MYNGRLSLSRACVRRAPQPAIATAAGPRCPDALPRRQPHHPHRHHPRRPLQTQRFSPLTPPDPASLPKPRPRKPGKPPLRQRKWPRRLAVLALLCAAALAADRTLNASALTRSLRTFHAGLVIGLDYKVNFRARPPFAASVAEVHARSARRVHDLLRANGGLYLKIGQAIAMQSAILPPEFQRMFAAMFDDAPQNAWADVERVVREDFAGRSVEDVFGVRLGPRPADDDEGGKGDESGAKRGVMERTARASASVAQVHWARLPDGREVAVKIQKREIASQVGWDLWAFKVVTRIYSWWFDIPMYTLVPYIAERLQLETDFENEADNSVAMKAYVESEPRLRGRVYIPKIYRELSSKRVMTAEWIEGVRLWDKDTITSPWRGGWGKGSPGAGGTPLGPPEAAEKKFARVPEDDVPGHRHHHHHHEEELLKPPRAAWRGPDGKGGLGLSLKAVMTTMVDLFSAQMFLWGLVHCDPHPGNVFVRRLPSGRPELVLIDHGLYVRMDPRFRRQYARMWKALLAFDNATIESVVAEWGVRGPAADMLASATLLRPYAGGDRSFEKTLRGDDDDEDEERAYRVQLRMRAGVKQMLGDEGRWPRELVFIARNQRIVQGNNAFLGSPVNRIKITGLWASRALAEDGGLSWGRRAREWARHAVFRAVLLASDVVWWYAWLRQRLGVGGGMEADIEERMKGVAKEFGVDLNHGLFEG
ncbi:ABC1 family-domain-containing protein [Lineolata rhizophorae]|uniref:ABC1 family-domain-containing protein n=1 Tax=Lineolata rhizophorae TaxID=578093 RepID=A0A6A6P9F3_9PEZI|nr:ABC1 family-domain-containing protein [Lineolata rhizophorae]